MKRCVLAFALMLIPGALHAQPPEPAWNGLDRSKLSTVFVLDDAGVETRGKLVRLDPDAIVVLVDGSERRFATERVARVSKRGDSLKNGAITGMVVGLAQAAIAIVIASQDSRASSSDKQLLAAMLLGDTAVYTAIGTAIDAAIPGRTVLYQAPTPRAVNQSRGGAAMSVRFTW